MLCRLKTAQVTALQWTGSNLAEMQSFLGYSIEEDDSGNLVLPDGTSAAVTDWIVIGAYRNIYRMENGDFWANLSSEDPPAETEIPS